MEFLCITFKQILFNNVNKDQMHYNEKNVAFRVNVRIAPILISPQDCSRALPLYSEIGSAADE